MALFGKQKKLLGIDIGYDQLKMALVDDGVVVAAVSAAMPENLLKDGELTSLETMSDLIRQTMKENNIKANHAALVLPNESVYVKNVSVPMMTTDQLAYNLPFEFNDYITGEVSDYIFDYAVLPSEENNEEEEQPAETEADPFMQEEEAPLEKLELMAVGAPRAVITDAQSMLRKAGLRLVKTAPALCTYISLIRRQRETLMEENDEFGILDLGYNSIRMYMYKEDRHVATRVLEIGLRSLDSVIADIYGVEVHLAHTYLMANFEKCLEREECVTSYENIAVELMRAMNFYRFSNPDSTLSDLWLCGGGAVIRPLTDAIGEMLDMRLHTASELVPGGDDIPECNSFVQAIGITMD